LKKATKTWRPQNLSTQIAAIEKNLAPHTTQFQPEEFGWEIGYQRSETTVEGWKTYDD